MHPHSRTHTHTHTLQLVSYFWEIKKKQTNKEKVQARSQNDNLQERPRTAQKFQPSDQPTPPTALNREGWVGMRGGWWWLWQHGGSWCGFSYTHPPPSSSSPSSPPSWFVHLYKGSSFIEHPPFLKPQHGFPTLLR